MSSALRPWLKDAGKRIVDLENDTAPASGPPSPATHGLLSGSAQSAQIERALRLSLNDLRPRQDLIDVGDIANSQTDKVTAALFAVNCEVKQGKIADSMSV
jgi:hypothetical protein